MIKKLNKSAVRGQTALILILLTAAALIFLSITLNWGRVASSKSMLSIAAAGATALLASDAASYGEQLKNTDLGGFNMSEHLNSIVLDVVMIVIVIVALIITIITVGLGSGVWAAVVIALAALSVVAAVVSLALQLAVIQPGICAMWNKLQVSQPIEQQFFEGGIGGALSQSVTDQVNITDYFDANTNGYFGINYGKPMDSVSRFAFFYTDRLKMLNRPPLSQIQFFYNQLEEFMNGQSCAQNYQDNILYPEVEINPNCIDPAATGTTPQERDYCNPDSTDPADASGGRTSADPACQLEIPGSFQLNDSCNDSDPAQTITQASSTATQNPSQTSYNPYCDPCCQPLIKKGKIARPSYCIPEGYPAACLKHPMGTYPAGPGGSQIPCPCQDPNDTSINCMPPATTPPRCVTNNPYSTTSLATPTVPATSDSIYPYLYDPTFQEFSNGNSFLDQFGRDQQLVSSPPLSSPPSPQKPPLTGMNFFPMSSSNGTDGFPNGIYPFFWMMGPYYGDVADIQPASQIVPQATTPPTLPLPILTPGQVHWCVTAPLTPGVPVTPMGYVPPSDATLAQFPDLAQLTLPYACQGPDCCVYYLANSLPGTPLPTPSPNPPLPVNGPIDLVGSSFGNPYRTDTTGAYYNPAFDPLFGEHTFNSSSSAAAPTTSGTPAMPPENAWQPGDNQMCLTKMPKPPYNVSSYSGQSSQLPDGSCEWKNDYWNFDPDPGATYAYGEELVVNPPPFTYNTSTVDALDETMHTLSDFVTFSNSILTEDIGTLNQSFHSWYNQARSWIAPECNSTNFPQCPAGVDSSLCYAGSTQQPPPECSLNAKGRLLNIYTPPGYPYNDPFGGWAYEPAHPVDILGSWNSAITSWLNMSFTPTGSTSAQVWCVPSETAIAGTSEDAFININTAANVTATPTVCQTGTCGELTPGLCPDGVTPCSIWGDMSHVLACLNYNAGGPAANNPAYSSFQKCLGELPTGATCPTTKPSDCMQFVPAIPATATTPAVPSSGGLIYPSTVTPPAYNGNPTDCDLTNSKSFAFWVNGEINYGPVYNYQQCFNYLTSATTCPPTPPGTLTGTVCDPSVLGRSLLPPYSGCTDGTPCSNNVCDDKTACVPAFGAPGSSSCSVTPSATDTYTYAHWIQDNVTLFTDETPKFVLRQSYLNDAYGMVQPMQSIFTSGDYALRNFFKTCEGCPQDGPNHPNTCAWTCTNPDGPVGNVCNDGSPGCVCAQNGTAGQCPDGSACGIPHGSSNCLVINGVQASCLNNICQDGTGSSCCTNGNQCSPRGTCGAGGGRCNYCANGGPAAQLIWARGYSQPPRYLPNSVIYGWTDKTLSNGSVLPSIIDPTTNLKIGGGAGYSHIVKVTAYGPGRDGPLDSNGNDQSGIRNMQTSLPLVQAYTQAFLQKYALQSRDGSVYVSVRRWDQEHGSGISFPNGHALWTMLFHNPSQNPQPGGGVRTDMLPTACFSKYSNVPGVGSPSLVGYGLQSWTIQGLVNVTGNSPFISSTDDQAALQGAFMINDNGDGTVDPNATLEANYTTCTQQAEALLSTGTESHACAEYIAAGPAPQPSDNGSSIVSGHSSDSNKEYSIKFVDCNTLMKSQPNSNP